MGLSAPKRRNKISHDPNNTSWSKSENGYGQKILSAQGWKPGDYLGVSNANHAAHYTAANASHIRILLREENLGLGAQIGKGNAETFGLSLFSGVLGRLNGKSDAEVEKQQSAIRDAELRNYHVMKFGLMNFVSGGLLVGDTIQPVQRDTTSEKREQVDNAPDLEAHRKSKKRKLERKDSKAEKSKIKYDESSHGHTNDDSPNRMRSEEASSSDGCSGPRSASNSKQHLGVESGSAHTDNGKSTSKERKRSNRKREEDKVTTPPASENPHCSKSEKRARKEERRRRKEEKRLKNLSSQASSSRASETEGGRDIESSISGSTTPSMAANPRLVRRRYIDQKRMASLDPKAMKEIFMLSATA